MEKLFTEFNAVSGDDWKKQIVKDLKGEAYESLQWQHDNGFVIEPFYTAENQKHSYAPAFTHHDWEISTAPSNVSSDELNKALLTRLDQGASSFHLNIAKHDLQVALNGVKLNYIHAAFTLNRNNVNHLRTYLETHYDLNEVQASLFYEAFDQVTNLDEWYRCMEFFFDHRKIKALSVDATPYHQLNAPAYLEIAIIFSALIQQLEYLNQKGCILPSDFVVKTGVNTDFFTQIAKLRAIRRLWQVFKSSYNIDNNLYIIVESSLTNKTIGDKHNNLLRGSIESIAAVVGGCNELIVHDYDAFNPHKDKMASRLAINQQLILKHESYFDKFADVSCGSYFIEHLTDSLASKALESFKLFEQQGGFLSCSAKGVFKELIQQHANLKQSAINDKIVAVIGVNKFRNEAEQLTLSEAELIMLKQLSINNPALMYELQHFVKHA